MRGFSKMRAPVLILLLSLTACSVRGGNDDTPEFLELVFVNLGHESTVKTIKVLQISEGGVLRDVPGSRFDVGGPFAVHPSGRFLYNESYCYLVDASTGALRWKNETGVTPLFPGAPFTYTASMFIDPTGRFLFQNIYVASEDINPMGPEHGFAVWRIDGATGALTRALGGVPLHHQAPYGSFVFDPDGKFAYMIGEGALFAYTIDPDTGGLADIPGSPYSVGYDRDREPFYSSAVHPEGKCIYFAGDSRLSIFAIDTVSGTLTEIEGSPVASGLFPMALSIDPLARFVYAASRDQNALFVYSVDPVTGSLSEAAGSPYTLPGPPRDVAVAPSGRYVYITITELGLIQAFVVNADSGVQTLTAGPQFVVPTATGHIVAGRIRQGSAH